MKDPEYTGQNRCLPCTVVNALIAVVTSMVVSLAALYGGVEQLAVPLGTAALVVAAGTIYFKGYLVPGTPTLTKRYFPQWLLAAFGKDDQFAGADENQEQRTDDDIDVESILLEADVLTELDAGGDLRLTDEFQAALHDQTDVVRDEDVSRERLLDVLGVEPGDVRFEEHGEAFRVYYDDRFVGTWESRPAFLADVAAAGLLADRLDEWDSTTVGQRGKLLNGFRLFLTTCPGCGGDLSFDMNTVESCCTAHDVAALTCEDCDARLFESEPIR